MITAIKRKLRNLVNLPVACLNNWKHRKSVKGKPVENVFTEIYENNYWGDKESISGSGSNKSQTRVIVEAIPALLKRHHIKSLLDLPCGDFNWMKKVDLTGMQYTGGDIVEQLVASNQAKFGSSNISFKKLNIIADQLPAVDMVLCRDCFIHLSNEQVLASLHNLKNQNIRYLLTTSYTKREKNQDISAGEWRPINIEIAPFNLKPLEVINENCTEDNGRWTDKSLLLIDLTKQA